MAKEDGLGPNQRKWLKALESGKFKQTRAGALKTDKGLYCCLGVACELFKTKGIRVAPDKDSPSMIGFNGETQTAPPFVMRALKLRDTNGTPDSVSESGLPAQRCSLTEWNDEDGTFKQIAKVIRARPEQFFKKPA
jgi:hypothetical protein